MSTNVNHEQNFSVNQNNVGIIYSATIVGYFLFSLIVNLIMSVLPTSDFLRRFISSFCSIVVLTVVIIVFGVRSEGTLGDKLSLKKFKPVYLVHVSFLLFAMFFGLGMLNSSVAKIFGIESSVLVINSVWEYLAYTLSICLLPAVVEEIFFRGMVQRALQPFGVFFSVFISALAFSLYHFNVTQLLYQFVFGVLFGGLFYLSKSVIPGMILHFFNNFVVLTLTYLGLTNEVEALLCKVGVIVSGCLMLVTIVIFGFIKIYKRREEHVVDKKPRRDFFVYSLTGMLVSILSIIFGVIG